MDKYIIMGTDECGDEFRADDKEYESMSDAQANVSRAELNYPEARGIWAELFRDQAYYQRHPSALDQYQ